MIYVNFEKNSFVDNLFDDLNPKSIIKNLEIMFNEKIDKDNTLIFFDEIQKNPKALTSLKYFCEEANEYYVVGAGSLLGVHLNLEEFSFPVGKVNFLTIYPLSFDEFLYNLDANQLIKEIKKAYDTNVQLNEALHQKAIEYYNDYLILGRMPEVINEYIKSGSLISAVEYQNEIIESYRSYIVKYCKDSKDAMKILSTFDSIPNQLAKDNKKFQYKVIQKGGTSSIFGESIEWLTSANIVNKCLKTNIGIPLKLYEEIDSFKLYMNDVGLLTNMSRYPLYLIKNRTNENNLMIGMITENYVASSLAFNNLELHYWKNDFDSEVDFILQTNNGLIIPIEVKSSSNVKSRSLFNYIKKYNPKYAIRLSLKNFGFENNIKSVPLYAAFCLTDSTLNIN